MSRDTHQERCEQPGCRALTVNPGCWCGISQYRRLTQSLRGKTCTECVYPSIDWSDEHGHWVVKHRDGCTGRLVNVYDL